MRPIPYLDEPSVAETKRVPGHLRSVLTGVDAWIAAFDNNKCDFISDRPANLFHVRRCEQDCESEMEMPSIDRTSPYRLHVALFDTHSHSMMSPFVLDYPPHPVLLCRLLTTGETGTYGMQAGVAQLVE